MARVTSDHIVYKIGLVEQLHRMSGHLWGHRETSGRRHPAISKELNIAGSSNVRTGPGEAGYGFSSLICMAPRPKLSFFSP